MSLPTNTHSKTSTALAPDAGVSGSLSSFPVLPTSSGNFLLNPPLPGFAEHPPSVQRQADCGAFSFQSPNIGYSSRPAFDTLIEHGTHQPCVDADVPFRVRALSQGGSEAHVPSMGATSLALPHGAPQLLQPDLFDNSLRTKPQVQSGFFAPAYVAPSALLFPPSSVHLAVPQPPEGNALPGLPSCAANRFLEPNTREPDFCSTINSGMPGFFEAACGPELSLQPEAVTLMKSIAPASSRAPSNVSGIYPSPPSAPHSRPQVPLAVSHKESYNAPHNVVTQEGTYNGTEVPQPPALSDTQTLAPSHVAARLSTSLGRLEPGLFQAAPQIGQRFDVIDPSSNDSVFFGEGRHSHVQTSLHQPGIAVIPRNVDPVFPRPFDQFVPSTGMPGVSLGFNHGMLNVSNAHASATEQLFESQMSIGYAYRKMGRNDLAAESFRAAACVRPDSSEARSCYALACHEQGLYETAVTEFHVALRLGAAFPDDVYNNLGNTYRSMGLNNEAELAYRTALNLSPGHAHAWNNLGNALRGRGETDDAMQCYSSSLTASPGFAPAHCNMAGLLRDQGKSREAEAQYRAALASDPHLAEAAAGLGTVLRDMGRAEEAIGYYLRAVELQPSGADHHANLANTYKDLNRVEESIVSYQTSLQLYPGMPDAFCNMVHSLSVVCDWRNRRDNFKVLLSIVDKQLDALSRQPSTHPRLVTTLVGALSNSTPKQVIVHGSSRSEREESALTRCQETKGKKIRHPSSPMSSRSGASSKTGDTTTPAVRGAGYVAYARKVPFSAPYASIVSPVISTGLPSVQPFHALIYPMTPEKFMALSAAYASRAEQMVQSISRVQQTWLSPATNHGRLKVGYVSSDYNNHPYSHLTQSVYGLHREADVECYCYALTPSDGSSWRLRIEQESEHFKDISALTALQSAQAIASDGIHVLVNCNGYTKGARTELFALRPAPVQVSFMGFPGTLGAHYIEYFISDTMTSPPQLAPRMHSESLLYHPHTYFVNDHRQTSAAGPSNYPAGLLTRAKYGLPENCFLFIMHNQLYKIDPTTFDVWARILKRVPKSKLWLLRFPPSGENRVREEARLRGLGPDRILFTDVASKDEHVARCGLGDLFLDTPTCNAHTTGTDALWSGIPLLTCPGSLFASRVAASLLRAAGLSELICNDMVQYEELAVELATNQSKLLAIRRKLESSRRTNPLFDTRRWVRNVEALYWQAWKRFEAGQPPAHIFGEDVMANKKVLVESDAHVERSVQEGNSSTNVDPQRPAAWHPQPSRDQPADSIHQHYQVDQGRLLRC